MRRLLPWCLPLLVAGVVMDALPADAQTRGRDRQERMRFQGMDANRDGVITRSEWRGNDRSFGVHDWNGDGVLSGDEVRPGARRPGRGGGARDLESPWDDQPITDWTREHYRWLDRDGNGRLTAAEWVYAPETFRRIDHNNDRWVSEAEFLGDRTVDDDAEDFFEYLDDNGDGRLSRAEWHGATGRFDALDTNNDGVLTRREVRGDEAPADLFDAIDRDRNGVLTRAEWRWSASSFDLRDHDRNDRLSRDEFVGLTADRTEAYRAGYARGLTEGRAAGREDRVRNQGWDLEGQRELVRADSGYQTRMGPREEYQAGYREGFRRGYREGWEAR